MYLFLDAPTVLISKSSRDMADGLLFYGCSICYPARSCRVFDLEFLLDSDLYLDGALQLPEF